MELFHPSRVEVMIQGLEMELGHEFPQKKYNIHKTTAFPIKSLPLYNFKFTTTRYNFIKKSWNCTT